MVYTHSHAVHIPLLKSEIREMEEEKERETMLIFASLFIHMAIRFVTFSIIPFGSCRRFPRWSFDRRDTDRVLHAVVSLSLQIHFWNENEQHFVSRTHFRFNFFSDPIRHAFLFHIKCTAKMNK